MRSAALIAVICGLSLAHWNAYTIRYGTNNYVRYQVGGAESKVVISAPHGGTLKPSGLTNRPSNGCYNDTNDECNYTFGCSSEDDKDHCGVKSKYSDQNTQYLAVELADSLKEKLGGTDAVRPHVIICDLHRSKLDANRDLGEAAFGMANATTAWKEYHDFIDDAKTAAASGETRILYIDLHGQSHQDWNMVGMLLPKTGSNGIDKSVLPDRLAQYSSIMQLHIDSDVAMEELVRGDTSIGGLMQADFDMIPSPTNKNAGTGAYYIGGYSLRRHTGWIVSGFQVEVYREIRTNITKRREFAGKLADATKYWLDHYLNIE